MKTEKKLFDLAIIMLFISSFSILLSFFGSYDGGIFALIMAYAVGILFWGFLILGYIMFAIVNSKRKKSEKNSSNKSERKRITKEKPGIICFFSNKAAMYFDFIMIISFVLTVVFSFIPILNKALCVVFMAILVFSIHMHCILNGVNFKYIYIISNRRV